MSLSGCVRPVREGPRSSRTVSNLRNGVGTASNDLVATVALPDTGGLALHGVLTAEGAGVTEDLLVERWLWGGSR